MLDDRSPLTGIRWSRADIKELLPNSDWSVTRFRGRGPLFKRVLTHLLSGRSPGILTIRRNSNRSATDDHCLLSHQPCCGHSPGVAGSRWSSRGRNTDSCGKKTACGHAHAARRDLGTRSNEDWTTKVRRLLHVCAGSSKKIYRWAIC